MHDDKAHLIVIRSLRCRKVFWMSVEAALENFHLKTCVSYFRYDQPIIRLLARIGTNLRFWIFPFQ